MCTKIVTTSDLTVDALMNHQKIKKLCKVDGVKPVGFIQGPEAERSETENRLKQILPITSPVIGIFAAWQF